MDDENLHPASLMPEQLAADCRIERLRRSGPGGQHRNKVETAVRLLHRPTGVRAEASERRSQAENRAVALERLRRNLALEYRRPWVPENRPSPLWRSRCVGGRIRVSALHADFPAMLAEALDLIAACSGDLKRAAESLGASPSQLVKFVKKENRALVLVNRWRNERGLGPLK
jgi:hypothetical protein